MPPKFVLASASPARRQLLQAAGIKPLVYQSNFDESQIQIADPAELVQTLAYHKAKSVAEKFQEPALVLGCDSVLALGGEIHGKPANPTEAIARWQKMRGQTGQLFTGHALIDLEQDKTLVRHQVTQVDFAPLSDRQIAAYVATGEPLQCAGCFALDGRGGLFVDKIDGCHSNVIGLSLPLLRQMLDALGYDVTDF
ncbi:Septum formation protein Maf [uncultured Synechococcales cyanobacterium]|uniref:Nucleoside triphosphate pyrophosphatase n=1 Tax=uncultured Synechococcales cyanobacterium TaxID=1936017 RepID=A0A6J4VL10_9CYAN|nr:Septum formation protein Maf [uncultured Synechococcales cyanobacterium]